MGGSKPVQGETFDITVAKRGLGKRFDKERYPGFSYSGTRYKPRWSRKKVPAAEADLLSRRAAEDRLAFEAVPSRYTRSSNYRERFLEANPGPWRCRYCHRKLDASTMTVDHIVPVAATSRSRMAQRTLEAMGAGGVNDLGNLAPACSACNSRKGSRGGLWIARGVLGEFGWYWALVWVARAAGLAVALLALKALAESSPVVAGIGTGLAPLLSKAVATSAGI